ncbi:magnesium transporter CorA family protein [Fictibacillus gelatini]|uniref:magnesium transporter CorA family protein n=1 Tax=Fictibacillus gelatini TaxID=225985 RepID=UPI000479B885|nr:magnesium transporter CorA family protein [Fictibacillus gelatini]
MEHRFKKNWCWHEFNFDNVEEIQQLIADTPVYNHWSKHITERKTNFLHVDKKDEIGSVLYGSLVYYQNPYNQNDYKWFHFFVSTSYFVTVGFDLSLLNRTNRETMYKEMDQCHSAQEGFFVLVGELLNNFLDGIDKFEYKLTKMRRDVQENNRTYLLDKIYDLRHELLNWNDLAIPVEELKLAAEEAFLDDITQATEYRRTCVRIERTFRLIQHYRQDIDTLLNLEEVLSSHRGNEIMKTLTVFTVIFTPAMVLGAIWGMNFKYMPELHLKYGYLYSLLIIGFSTVAVYIWLRMKGWTGDLLKKRKNIDRGKIR